MPCCLRLGGAAPPPLADTSSLSGRIVCVFYTWGVAVSLSLSQSSLSLPLSLSLLCLSLLDVQSPRSRSWTSWWIRRHTTAWAPPGLRESSSSALPAPVRCLSSYVHWCSKTYEGSITLSCCFGRALLLAALSIAETTGVLFLFCILVLLRRR